MTNKKRLIDANEIEELFYNQIKWGATDLMDAFDDALQDAQTVDAVEVVRCGDCTHTAESTILGCVRCLEHGATMLATNYCAHGERKGND